MQGTRGRDFVWAHLHCDEREREREAGLGIIEHPALLLLSVLFWGLPW